MTAFIVSSLLALNANSPPLDRAPALSLPHAPTAACSLAPPPSPPLLAVPPAQAVRVESSESALRIDPARRQVELRTKLRVKSVAGPTTVLYFYLSPFAPKEPRVSDELGELSVTEVASNVWAVPLRGALSPGQVQRLTFVRSGVPECRAGTSPFGGTQCELREDYVLRREPWEPRLFDGPQARLAPSTLRTLAVTVPAGLFVGAEGMPRGSTTNPDGTTTFRFEAATEGNSSLAVGRYTVGLTAAPFGQVSSLVTSANAGRAADWRHLSAQIMEAHRGRYGPYFGTGLQLVETAQYPMFADEGAIYMHRDYLAQDPRAPFSAYTLAHELGHQWFGLTLRNGEYTRSPWMSEGLSSHAEMQFTIDRVKVQNGVEVGPWYRLARGQQYLYGLSAPGSAALLAHHLQAVRRALPDAHLHEGHAGGEHARARAGR